MSEQGNVEINVNTPAKENDELDTGQTEPNVISDPPAEGDEPANPSPPGTTKLGPGSTGEPLTPHNPEDAGDGA